MRTLNLIGAGRLGRTLARLWTKHNVLAVQDLLTNHASSAAEAAKFIGAGRPVESQAAMQAADAWLLTPPDDRIAACGAALAASGRLRAGDLVFHCSGAQPASVLSAAARAGALTASVHPLKSIADPAHAVQTFAGTWCGAEGDTAALAILKPAFEAIGARLFDIDSQSKAIYHAASVIVSNYLAALIEAGVRCYGMAGLARNTALQVMEPLAREALDNIFAHGTAGALTGPIARGDQALVARQLEALAARDPQIAAIYRQLGAIAVELAREQGKASADTLAAIERTLSGDR